MKTKFETMFVLHVRFDMNTPELHRADSIAEALRRYISEQLIENPPYFMKATAEEIETTDGPSTYEFKTRITYAGIRDFVTSLASASRRSPNVWNTGRLMTMSGSVADWTNNLRRIPRDSELGSRAQHLCIGVTNFDSWLNEGKDILLPTVPLATSRMIIGKALAKFSIWNSERWSATVQECAVEVLDSMYEDGLPAGHELTDQEVDIMRESGQDFV